MDNEQARSILSLHRRMDEGNGDPRFREAEKLAERDPELAHWWTEERDVDDAISAQLTSVPVPPGLKQRILSQTQPIPAPNKWLRPVLLAAACLVALAVLFASWRSRSHPPMSLAEYRSQMVNFIDGYPPLALETRDLSQLTAFLARTDAPRPSEIPKKLRELEPIGCRTLQFHGENVALICFRRENGTTAHLFVMKSTGLGHLSSRDTPVYAPSGKWMTAAWGEDGNAYLVLVEGDLVQIKNIVGTS